MVTFVTEFSADVYFHSHFFLYDCVCPFPELPQSEHISVADATWLALNVVSGGGNASNSQPIGVTKIAKSVIAPLADHNISVFMLSTYQTDFILVSVNNKLQNATISRDNLDF